MQTASSANRTCSELRSASEYTATVAIPNSLQAQMTRSAISPRLATRIFWNIVGGSCLLLAARANSEQGLTVLDRLPVFDKNAQHFPADIRFDFVHQLHGFHDAHRRAGI